jgi:hypothetical protein
MADPQSLLARIESGNERSENEGNSDLYESLPNPQVKDYVSEEEVYNH